MKSTSPQHVMIVAGEASGDLHGSNLVRSMLKSTPELTFSGMGGRELGNAGVDILFDAARIAVVGVFEVVSHLGDILKARRVLIEEMCNKRPAVLIIIDFPDFNLLLAAKAKKLGIPVYYYISPQIWAWRTQRVKKIARLTDRIGVILPFEKAFYAKHGYHVDYVGHPLLDTVARTKEPGEFLAEQDIPQGNLRIGIVPGSRSKEVRNLLKDFLDAAILYSRQSSRPCTFLLPRASTVSMELLLENGLLEAQDNIDIRVISDNRYNMMSACHAVMAASGTVTLELAILGIPTVVAYRLAPTTFMLGKLLIRHLQYFSLVNLIAEKEVFPELLQDEVTPQRLAAEIDRLLTDAQAGTIAEELRLLRQKLGGAGASDKAAAIALEIIDAGQ